MTLTTPQSTLPSILAAQPQNTALRRRTTDVYFTTILTQYTAREMTNDGDSLNACLGMLNLFQRHLVSSGFNWGLPLGVFPQSLRWYHMRWVKPRRRPGFPSWSFVGWAGEAAYTDGLILENEPSLAHLIDLKVDLGVEFVRVDDKVLTLKGHVLTLEIRNQPFNDGYVPETDMLVGMLQEGSAVHKNTLPEGVYQFVVVERLWFRKAEGAKMRHTVYLLMLGDQEGGVPTRRAMVRLFVEPDVVETDDYHGLFRRQDDIQIV